MVRASKTKKKTTQHTQSHTQHEPTNNSNSTSNTNSNSKEGSNSSTTNNHNHFRSHLGLKRGWWAPRPVPAGAGQPCARASRESRDRVVMALLVSDDAIQTIPCDNHRGVFEHIRDRLGQELNDVEILAWIDKHFLLSSAYTLKLNAKTGKLSVTRHAENQQGRGDAASVASKKKSVEVFSTRQEWRAAPWLVQDEDISNDEDTLSLHGGTLLDGAKQADIHDPTNTKTMVQLAMSTPILNCRLYRRAIVKHAARFLVGRGNKNNDDGTVTTILSVWRETNGIEPAWARHKDLKGLDTYLQGRIALNN